MVQEEELEAKEEHPVEVAEQATAKVEEGQGPIRVYDSWGCPGATRETRDVLGSPFCCSRTSNPTMLLCKRSYVLFNFDLCKFSDLMYCFYTKNFNANWTDKSYIHIFLKTMGRSL